MSELQLPDPFGPSWEDFSREWCSNCDIAYSADEVRRALDTLQRLVPAEFNKMAAESARGAAVVVPRIDIGLLLADCEAIDKFESVLTMYRNGDRSAYSQMVLAAALRRLGHSPCFEEPLGQKVLDVTCEVSAQKVFFEVVAPERAERSLKAQRMSDDLMKAVRAAVSACRVEVELLEDPTPERHQSIVSALQATSGPDWIDVESIARIRKISTGQALSPTFDGTGANVVFAEERTTQGPSTSVVMRWRDNDERAKRVFNHEYEHFSDHVPNVLVVDTCAIGGIKEWQEQLNRLFQPGRNRKVGAVVLFDQGILGPPEAIRRRWKAMRNPHAHVAVPNPVIDGLEGLSDPM